MIERLVIIAPPLEQQRVIARILGALDEKIEMNRRTCETLEAIGQTLFAPWFVDFEPVHAKCEGRTPSGMDAETAQLFPNAFAGSKSGPIPRGWQLTTMGDVTSKTGSGSTPRGGDTAYIEEGVALIRSQNVYDSKFIWDGLVRITDDEAE
jgi:type I restriction enzyme S subunit